MAMSEAALRPEFQRGGAPVSVLIDFDGTLSLRDVGDVLLGELVVDQALVRSMDQRYLDGQAGSRELIAWDMEVLPHEPALLHGVVDALPLDDTFADLIAAVDEMAGAIEIVSDGVGFHIERMLAGAGLPDMPVATNRSVLGAGADGVTFPYGHPRCFVCGTCKRERIRIHQAADRAVVFVGDGPSDRYAAHHADVIFAKASLAAWCDSEGIRYEAWERLADVAAWLRSATADGRLPADQAGFGAWATRTRPSVATFICGPERWGEGRATADISTPVVRPSGPAD